MDEGDADRRRQRPDVDPGRFRSAMRQLASGVSIITTRHGTQRRGLTATSVCSLSLEPPSLVACVNRSAEAHDMIAASRCLCVNVLAAHHQILAEIFAARDGTKGDSRFLRGNWGTLVTGAPFLTDSLAAFDCEVWHSSELFTHTLFVCRVVTAHGMASDDPLVYFDGGFTELASGSARHPARGIGREG